MGRIKAPNRNHAAKSSANKEEAQQHDAKKSELTEADDVPTKSDENRVKTLVGKVHFKAANKKKKADNGLSTFTKLKSNKLPPVAKSKYAAITSSILQQVKIAETANGADDATAASLTFIKRPQSNRLTNMMLKQIMTANKSDKPMSAEANLTGKAMLQGVTKLSKKGKQKLKANVWQERIGLIKNQLKEDEAKKKRAKIAITGDMKPMIESLEAKQVYVVADAKKKNGSSEGVEARALTRREKKERNRLNEQSKPIPKQTVRDKKSQEDMSLFSQLLDFKEFTSNPLEKLKKHFNA